MQMGFRGPTSNSRDARYERCLTVEAVSQVCCQGQLTEAVEVLGVLVQTDCWIPQSLFYTLLKSCVVHKDLVLGRRLHALIIRGGYISDTFLCNHIMRMYASNGRLQDAMEVFTLVAKPDVFTWSAIISAHVQHGQDKQAIVLYHRMRRSSVKPDAHGFVAALQACGRGADLRSGQQVHADVLASGVESNLFVSSCLVDMYAKCGCLEDAQRVFDGLGERNVVIWNAMIAAYAQQGMGQEALRLYRAMQDEGVVGPSSVTFVCLLQACGSVGVLALEKGKQLHAQIQERGLLAEVFVANSLVDMYAKCGSIQDAQGVFDGLGQKDVVTWNAMIAGYSQQGMGQEALDLYRGMQEEGIVVPDSVTFVCLLLASALVGSPALETGRQLHEQIREQGLQRHVIVANSLVNMYAKCGSLEDARAIFDILPEKDVVTWSAMISGYSQQGMGHEALHLYRAMQDEGSVAPGCVTFVCLLQACATVGPPALEMGKQLHVTIREQGLQADLLLNGSLVCMYAKCGSLEGARGVFDSLHQKDVATWNAMIGGYSQQGMGQEALGLYRAMRESVVAPDSITFVCLLQVCANLAALHVGRQLHAHIKTQGLQEDVLIASGLISMYGKAGSMVDAQQVFDALPRREIVTWSALVAGYARQGLSKEVFDLFVSMRQDGIQPDGVMFLSVLTACSHTGLVSKGQEYFDSMSRRYGITPTVDHYTCMVDLLGRAGQLGESLALIRTMPVLPNKAIWHALLSACRKWSNVEMGLHAFNEAVTLDKKDAAAYVLMSNIYSGAQMWEQALALQARRTGMGARKQPGKSFWTDMEGLVHSFLVGDKMHPEIEGIHASLNQLLRSMTQVGQVPPLHQVFSDGYSPRPTS